MIAAANANRWADAPLGKVFMKTWLVVYISDDAGLKDLYSLIQRIENEQHVISVELKDDAAQQSLEPDGGSRPDFIDVVNSLANIVIEASGKGYVSSNDLDFANDCLDKVIPLLKPAAG